jgi:hypothetical protein
VAGSCEDGWLAGEEVVDWMAEIPDWVAGRGREEMAGTRGNHRIVVKPMGSGANLGKSKAREREQVGGKR